MPFTLTAEQVASISSLNLKIVATTALSRYQWRDGRSDEQYSGYAGVELLCHSTMSDDLPGVQLADYPITNASVLNSEGRPKHPGLHGMDASGSQRDDYFIYS